MTNPLQDADCLAWRRLYEGNDSPEIWHPLPFIADLVQQLGSHGGPLVDLACGDGAQITGMSRDLEIVGVDQCEVALQHAVRRVRGAGHQRVRLVKNRVESLPFVDGSAGGAVLIDILSSFLEPLPILSEAYRVLRPGAALAITTFSPRDPLALDHPGTVAGEPVWIGGFINIFYEEAAVVGMMRAAGFGIENAFERVDPDDPHPGYREQPHVHDRLVVVGRK